jgi:hypothetical protein
LDQSKMFKEKEIHIASPMTQGTTGATGIEGEL